MTNEGLIKAIAAIDAEYREEATQRQKELVGRPPTNSGPKEPQLDRSRSAEQTGKALGVSKSTVERVRAIEDEEEEAAKKRQLSQLQHVGDSSLASKDVDEPEPGRSARTMSHTKLDIQAIAVAHAEAEIIAEAEMRLIAIAQGEIENAKVRTAA